jgi:hypothetical protein
MADELPGLLALLCHDDVDHRLDLVPDVEEVEGELLDRAAAGQVFEGMIDRGGEKAT